MDNKQTPNNGSRLRIILLLAILAIALAVGLYLILSSGKQGPAGPAITDSLSGKIDTNGQNGLQQIPDGEAGTQIGQPQGAPDQGRDRSAGEPAKASRQPTDLRTDLNDVERKVSVFKPQITKLYLQYNQIKRIKGTLRFDLSVNADGKVISSQVAPQSGEFYPEFLQQVKDLTGGWKFDNTNALDYTFYMTFSG